MPAVAGPDSPGVEARDKLPDDRFSPSALLNREAGPWPLLLLFGLVRRQQAHPFTKKTLGELGAVIVPVPQRPAFSAFVEQLFSHVQIMDVGRGKAQATDYPRPAHPKVGSQPIEGLLVHLVVAEGALLS